MKRDKRQQAGEVLAIWVLLFGMANFRAARANCARPVSYDVTVDSNQVTICPQNWEGRSCPDKGGMLRQDQQSGQVVRLPDRCTKAASGKPCYIDSCVPAGSYRYGFFVPYKCHDASCSTDYFAPAQVTATGECKAPDAEKAIPFAQAVPWGKNSRICSYGGCSLGFGSLPMQVLSVHTLVLLLGVAIWRRRRSR